jgi:hypothetical protein
MMDEESLFSQVREEIVDNSYSGYYRMMKGLMFYAIEPKRQTPEPYGFFVSYVYTKNPALWGESKFDNFLKLIVKVMHTFRESVMKGASGYVIEGTEIIPVDVDEMREIQDELDGEFDYSGRVVPFEEMQMYALIYKNAKLWKRDYGTKEIWKFVKNQGIKLTRGEMRMTIRQFLVNYYQESPLPSRFVQSLVNEYNKDERGKRSQWRDIL